MVKNAVSWIAGIVLALFALTSCSADSLNRSQSYQSFQNGFEVEAKSYSVKCEMNGDCKHTYRCKPRTTMQTTYAGNGNYFTTPKRRYQKCPYTQQETTFTVETTFGETVYGKNIPIGVPFEKDTVIPEEFTLQPPKPWIEAQQRLEKGEPRGVTEVKETTIPPQIDKSLETQYAADVDALNAKNLLPDMPDGTFGAYYAEKAHVIEHEPQHHFLRDIEHINGALAIENKDIEVHAVFIGDSADVDPDTYTNALLSYWQSDAFEKNKLPNNALVIVIGVNEDTETVTWARVGGNAIEDNTAITEAFQEQLPEKPMDDNLFGRPSYNLETGTVEHSDGIVENILWDESNEL